MKCVPGALIGHSPRNKRIIDIPLDTVSSPPLFFYGAPIKRPFYACRLQSVTIAVLFGVHYAPGMRQLCRFTMRAEARPRTEENATGIPRVDRT